MKATFTVPTTARIQIIYTETLFMGNPCKPYNKITAPVDNPGSPTAVQMFMLGKGVGVDHVVGCLPVAPRPDWVSSSPAEHKVAQYMRMANT